MSRFGTPEALSWLCTHGAHADSVELKALLAGGAGPAAEALTGRGAPTWSVRRLFLLDTPRLDLVRAGVEVRLRRRARGRHDLAVSTRRRGAEPESRAPRCARVELDVVPGELWQDIEVRRDVDPASAAAVVDGTADPGRLLSTAQRGWARHGGTARVDDAVLAQLRVHGPLIVHRVKVSVPRLGLERADLEHVRYGSGRELVELSTRCRPRDVHTTATAFERLLDERDVALAPTYRSKTAVWSEEMTAG